MSLRFTLKSAMLCAALSSAVIAPLPALADTTYIMITNTRSEDGVYRPALRVIRGGTVTYYRTDDSTLTADILQDKSALTAWLVANAGMTAEEAGSVVLEVAPNADQGTGGVKAPSCMPGFTLIQLPNGWACRFEFL